MMELPLYSHLALCNNWLLLVENGDCDYKGMVGTIKRMGVCSAWLPTGMCSGESWALHYAEWARSTERSSCLPVMPHLRGQANWISVIWGDRQRRSAWCLQRCAQEVLEQAKGKGLYKYVNIFFWRLEIANGIELWVYILALDSRGLYLYGELNIEEKI